MNNGEGQTLSKINAPHKKFEDFHLHPHKVHPTSCLKALKFHKFADQRRDIALDNTGIDSVWLSK
jgi:hypothetical protein